MPTLRAQLTLPMPGKAVMASRLLGDLTGNPTCSHGLVAMNMLERQAPDSLLSDLSLPCGLAMINGGIRSSMQRTK